jgi:hypothetical protein
MNLAVPHNSPGVGEIVNKAVRGNRKPINVREFKGPKNVNSYWDEGTKDEYTLVSLDGAGVWNVPTSHPYFDRKENGERCGNLELSELPPNTALVEHGCSRGKERRPTVYFRKENLVKLLVSPVDLSEQERKALMVVSCVTGNYRKSEWQRKGLPGVYSGTHPLVVALHVKGLVKVNKAGAVKATLEGKNALTNEDKLGL